MLKSLLKKLSSLLILTLLVASIFRFELHSLYVHHYVFNKVNVLQMPVVSRKGTIQLRNFCSGSQVTFKGKQFTITNLHCCAVADRTLMPAHLNELAQIGLVGKSLWVDGKKRKIVSVSRDHDLCLVEPIVGQSSFRLAPFTYMQQPVSVIGHPRGLPRVVRPGHIIDKSKAVFPWLDLFVPRPFTMLSTITYPGNSGSPVIDLFGNLVGLVFAGFSGYHTEGFMVPLEDVRAFLEEHVSRK